MGLRDFLTILGFTGEQQQQQQQRHHYNTRSRRNNTAVEQEQEYHDDDEATISFESVAWRENLEIVEILSNLV